MVWNYIYNSIWAAVNNDVCGHEWGDSPIIFTSDSVTSENYWQITSRVTTNIVINGSPYIISFLTWFSSAETGKSMKTAIDRSLHHCCGIVKSHKHLLWRNFWSIVMRTFLSRSRASSHHRQVYYHLLIIKNYSRRFHWLACKNYPFSNFNGCTIEV